MTVELALLDTVASAGDPDGAGPLTAGYDPIFHEPVMVPPPTGSARGTPYRVDDLIRLPAQVEPEEFEALQMAATGSSPRSLLRLTFHYKDLELAGLLDATTKRPQLRINTRLVAVYDIRTAELIETIPDPPGLFARQVQSADFGLSSFKRNLLVVTFMERALSDQGAAR